MGVVGILTLGMAASTVVFGVFQSVLLKPLPFRDSARVVELAEMRLERGIDSAAFSEANVWDVRAQNHSFEKVGAYHYDDFNLIGNGSAEKVEAAEVTSGFFRTLGVAHVLGRDFSNEEDRGSNKPAWWNGQRVVILGNRFWRSRFGAEPNILGKTLRLDDQTYTAIGVLSPAEFWIDRAVYVPFGYRANPDRGSWEFSVIGRLARGVSPEAAGVNLQRIAATLGREYSKEDKGIGFKLDTSSSWVVPTPRGTRSGCC
jgi:putative ABC transport system permease protein